MNRFSPNKIPLVTDLFPTMNDIELKLHRTFIMYKGQFCMVKVSRDLPPYNVYLIFDPNTPGVVVDMTKDWKDFDIRTKTLYVTNVIRDTKYHAFQFSKRPDPNTKLGTCLDTCVTDSLVAFDTQPEKDTCFLNALKAENYPDMDILQRILKTNNFSTAINPNVVVTKRDGYEVIFFRHRLRGIVAWFDKKRVCWLKDNISSSSYLDCSNIISECQHALA